MKNMNYIPFKRKIHLSQLLPKAILTSTSIPPDFLIEGISSPYNQVPQTLVFIFSADVLENFSPSPQVFYIADKSLSSHAILSKIPNLIFIDSPRDIFKYLIAEHAQPIIPKKIGIEKFAFIHPQAILGKHTYIGSFTYIDANAHIGSNVMIFPFSYIGENVKIGDNTIIYPHVIIYPNCIIGKNCIIHSGVVIGADGFGFAPINNEWKKLPHYGNVIIQDNTEIGANTTIDKALLGSTIIEKGVKLDNLIQVAHNVHIGENTVIAAQTGIAGSSSIGKNCMIGGQVGIRDHIKIANNTKIAAKSAVAKSLNESGEYAGIPATNGKKFLKIITILHELPDLYKKIKEYCR